MASAERHIASRDYRAALIELKSLLQHDPGSPGARWLLGTVYLEVEDGASAEKEFRQARGLGIADDAVLAALSRALLLQNRADDVLALEPQGDLSPLSRAELEASRALALSAKGDREAALTLIGNAVKAAPHSPWVRYAQASLSIQPGAMDEAKQLLEALVKDVPKHGRAWSLLGQLHESAADYAAAEHAFSKAIEYRPRPQLELSKRGLARLAQGNIEGLAEDAELLVKWAPKWYQSSYLNGLVHVQRKDFARAAEAFEEAVSLNDQHFQSVFLLAATQDVLGNKARALSMAERAQALQPNNIAARKLLASMHIRERRGREAERLLRPVVADSPTDLQAKDILATSLILQNQPAAAAEILQEVALERSDEARAQVKAGAALLAAGQTVAGLEFMRRTESLAVGDPTVHRALIASLLGSELGSEALEAARRYVQSAPDDPAAWNLLGVANRAVGGAEEASTAFLKALDLDHGNPLASRQLADLAVQRGDLHAARRLIEDALALKPSTASLLYALAELELRDGRPELARDLLERTVALDELWIAPRLALARILTSQGEAQAVIDTLTAIPDHDPRASLLRARALITLRDYAEARNILNARVGRLPDAPDTYYLLAQVDAALGDRTKLEENLTRVLQLAPQSIYGKLAMARLRAVERRFDEADSILASLDASLEEEPAVLDTRLFVAGWRGNLAQELEFSQRLFDVQPSSANLLSLSRALIRAGQKKKAIDGLEKWWMAHPTDLAVGRALSEFYVASDVRDKGIGILQKLSEAHPDNVTILNNLAWELRVTDPAVALTFAERAYGLAPQSPAVLDTLAEVLVRNRQIERGLAMIENAIQIDRQSWQLIVRRAELQKLAGDIGGAINTLESLEADPDTPAEGQSMAATLKRRWAD